MRQILFLSFIMVYHIVQALPTGVDVAGQNKAQIFQKPLIINQNLLPSVCLYKKSYVTFMPILIAKAKDKDDSESILQNNFESAYSKQIIDKLIELPSLFYMRDISVINLEFIAPSENFLKWQSENTYLLDSLRNLPVTESINLPQRYRQKGNTSEYMLFSILRRLEISDNRDNIPQTHLISLIASINMQVLFVVVSASDGVIVKKFVATGHSGVSQLLNKTESATNYGINYSSLVNDALSNFIEGIQNSMSNAKLSPCVFESSIVETRFTN